MWATTLKLLNWLLRGLGLAKPAMQPRMRVVNPARVAELSKSVVELHPTTEESKIASAQLSEARAKDDARLKKESDELLTKNLVDPGWDKPKERDQIREWVRTKHDWLEPYSRFHTISKVASVPGTPEYEAYVSIINHWVSYQLRFIDPVIQKEIEPYYLGLDADTIRLIVSNELGSILDGKSAVSPSAAELISLQLQRLQKAPNGLNGKPQFTRAGSGLTYHDGMDPYEYEHFCARLLKGANWRAEATKGSGDQGVDVIAEKFGYKVAIQVKKYASPAGNGAVQEILAGKLFYDAEFGVVVCTAGFTRSAHALAKKTGIHLMHHDDLCNLESILPSNSYFSKASYNTRK